MTTIWQGRRVFLTGHTGFKGGWLALWLSHLGAQVRGFSLDPSTSPSLFETAHIADHLEDLRGDIRNPESLSEALTSFGPEIVFHLAAQPLVRASYADPIGTFSTNVLGTANLLEAVRHTPSVRAVVCITTDKVYQNPESGHPFRESDPLGGHDPYSASKACSELVAASFRSSFLAPSGVHLATARAGNVIGGGDFSPDRLLPDLLRGFTSGHPVLIRHPDAIRPWQHVLDPLAGYLRLAERLLSPQAAAFANPWNFGPSHEDARPVSWIAHQIADQIASQIAGHLTTTWLPDPAPTPHEAASLHLDSTRAHVELPWTPKLALPAALDWLLRWHRAHAAGEDMQAVTLAHIRAFEALS